jgi:TolA-binding protein
MENLTRLSLPLPAGGSFRLVQEPEQTRLEVRGTELSQLQGLRGRRDIRVAGIEILPQGLNGVEIRIPHSIQGLQAFAYQQKSELVVDLWSEQEKASSAQGEPAKNQTPTQNVQRTRAGGQEPMAAPRVAKKSVGPKRAPAQEAIVQKSEEIILPLKRGQDLFQRFPLPNPPLRFSANGRGIDIPPSLSMAVIRPLPNIRSSQPEGEAYNLARSLYKQKKFGLAIKAVEIARRDYPQSSLESEFLYLDVLAKIALSEELKAPALRKQAEDMLREMADEKVKGKPAVTFDHEIRLYFGIQYFNQQNWLGAIEDLEAAAKNLAVSDPNYFQLKILLAEAYGATKENRRAERLFRYLEEKHGSHPLGKEAAYRKVGLLAREQNYERVIAEGLAAIEKFPSHSKVRGEVFFLLGESFFWRNDLARSEEYFRRFVAENSVNTNAGLALVRLGELAEIRRGDLEESRKLYLEAKNRHPFSFGDLVATVRLARLDVHREKDPEFVVKTLREMLADANTPLELRQNAELALADYLTISQKHNEAVSLTQSGMAKYDGAARESFRRAFSRALFHQVAALNRGKNPAAALAVYQEHKKLLDLYGPAIHREMGRAYQAIGLLELANQSNERFLKEQGNGRMLASDTQSLNLEKAQNAFSKGQYAEVLQYLEQQESSGPEQRFLKVQTLHRLKRTAEAHQEALQLMRTARLDQLQDKEWGFLVEPILERAEKSRDYPRLEQELRQLNRKVSAPNERIAFAICDAVWMQRNHGEAIQEINATLESFPKSERAQRARYQLGMSYLSLKKREEAVKALTAASTGEANVWSDSARKELELIDWEKKYSSVLRGLPPSGLGIKGTE